MKKLFFASTIIIVLCVVVYQERRFLLEKYASLYVIDNATKGADAILMLAGSLDSRVNKTIKLYKEEYAPAIWTVTPYERKTKYPQILKEQNILLAEILAFEGIDRMYILPSFKQGATSTFDEAYDLAFYLKSNPIKRLIIVTDGFHTLRSKIAFEKVFAKMGIPTQLEFAPSFSEDFSLSQWHLYEKSLYRLLVQEPIGVLFYWLNDANSVRYINQ